MTAIKAKSERRTILDFSSEKCSKNRIKQSLRQCEIINRIDFHEFIIYSNQIKIGMYTITLELPFDSPEGWHKLKDYRDFQIAINDDRPIDLKKDARFKHQYWVSRNFFGKLRIKHLVDIISYCHRLNKLRAFL